MLDTILNGLNVLVSVTQKPNKSWRECRVQLVVDDAPTASSGPVLRVTERFPSGSHRPPGAGKQGFLDDLHLRDMLTCDLVRRNLHSNPQHMGSCIVAKLSCGPFPEVYFIATSRPHAEAFLYDMKILMACLSIYKRASEGVDALPVGMRVGPPILHPGRRPPSGETPSPTPLPWAVGSSGADEAPTWHRLRQQSLVASIPMVASATAGGGPKSPRIDKMPAHERLHRMGTGGPAFFSMLESASPRVQTKKSKNKFKAGLRRSTSAQSLSRQDTWGPGSGALLHAQSSQDSLTSQTLVLPEPSKRAQRPTFHLPLSGLTQPEPEGVRVPLAATEDAIVGRSRSTSPSKRQLHASSNSSPSRVFVRSHRSPRDSSRINSPMRRSRDSGALPPRRSSTFSAASTTSAMSKILHDSQGGRRRSAMKSGSSIRKDSVSPRSSTFEMGTVALNEKLFGQAARQSAAHAAVRSSARHGASTRSQSPLATQVSFQEPEMLQPTLSVAKMYSPKVPKGPKAARPMSASGMSQSLLRGTAVQVGVEERREVQEGRDVRHSSLQNSVQEWQTDLRKGEVAASQDASAQGAPNARQRWFPIRTLEEEEDRRREMQLAAQLNHPDLAFEETNAWRTTSLVAPRLRVAVPGTPLTGTSRITTPASGTGPMSAASSLITEDSAPLLHGYVSRGVLLDKDRYHQKRAGSSSSSVTFSTATDTSLRQPEELNFDFITSASSDTVSKKLDVENSDNVDVYQSAWLESQEENKKLRESVKSLEAQCKMLAKHLGLEDQLQQQCGH